jgi:hypothetical protein
VRTTLTLDDDLAALLKERARQLGVSFKVMVNKAIRAGLSAEAQLPKAPPPRVEPHSFGFRPGIDLDKLGQLADELEAEEFTDKLGRRPR